MFQSFLKSLGLVKDEPPPPTAEQLAAAKLAKEQKEREERDRKERKKAENEEKDYILFSNKDSLSKGAMIMEFSPEYAGGLGLGKLIFALIDVPIGGKYVTFGRTSVERTSLYEFEVAGRKIVIPADDIADKSDRLAEIIEANYRPDLLPEVEPIAQKVAARIQPVIVRVEAEHPENRSPIIDISPPEEKLPSSPIKSPFRKVEPKKPVPKSNDLFGDIGNDIFAEFSQVEKDKEEEKRVEAEKRKQQELEDEKLKEEQDRHREQQKLKDAAEQRRKDDEEKKKNRRRQTTKTKRGRRQTKTRS